MSALADLRVVDLSTGVAGPFCTKLFADFGADVIKIEPVDGDCARTLGPFPGDHLDRETSGIFIYLNSNKRGATLSIESSAGAELAQRLFETADVVVESFSPGHFDRLGFDYQSLSRDNPGVVHVSITPFGQNGPWRDYQDTELVLHAASGQSNVNGSPGREPLKEPGFESYLQTGACAFAGAMTALANRDVTGEGQRVDISVLESAASMFAPQFLGAMHTGRPVERGSTPLLPCKDGFVSLNVRHDATWEYMWLFFDDPDIAHDPRFATAADRRERADEIEMMMMPHLTRFTMAELFHGLAPLRILIGMTMAVDSLVQDPHLAERGFFETVSHPLAGDLLIPGVPVKLSRTPGGLDRSAPTLGQHNREVFCEELGYDEVEIDRWHKQGVV